MLEELCVEERETLKSAIQRFINDLNLPPNIELLKAVAPGPDEEEISKISNFLFIMLSSI